MSMIMTEDLHDLALEAGKEIHDEQFPNCKQKHEYEGKE